MFKIVTKRSIIPVWATLMVVAVALATGQLSATESDLLAASAETSSNWHKIVFAISEVDVDPTQKLSLTERVPIKDEADQKQTKEAANSVTVGKATSGPESRLQALQKPLGSIEFTKSPESAKAPTNVVSDMLAAGAPRFVTSLSRSTPVPNRYPVFAQHNPLYFEDINLERCGTTYGCAQTAVSAAKFFTQVAILPYRIVDRPWCTLECDRLDCQSRGVSCKTPIDPPCNELHPTNSHSTSGNLD